jgi:hypothetical protein
MTSLLLIALAVQTVGSMSTARAYPSMTVLADGRVLVAGGTGSTGTLTTAEIYDPTTRTFRATSGPMANGHSSPTSVLLNDGRVIVSGGDSPPGPAIEIYDPATDRFTTPPQPASRHLYAPLVKLPDGRVLLASGTDEVQISTTLVEIFDPAANSWSAAGNLVTPRFQHGAELLRDGRVLIVGGRGPLDYADSEIYDPASKTSVDLPATTFTQPIAVTLADGRAGVLLTTSLWVFDESAMAFTKLISGLPTSGQSATRLVSGLLLLAGGFDPVAGAPSPIVLVIDPTLGTFEQIGTLTVPRAYAGTAVLNDGSVLIAGGLQSSSTPLASAELWSVEQKRRAAHH